MKHASFLQYLFFLSISISLFHQNSITAQASQPRQEQAELVAAPAISVMSYNVENLFDTVDDPEKDDDTFLPLALKKSAAHKAKCKKLRGASRQKKCLTLDWSEKVLAAKLKKLRDVILSVKQGKGPDILFLVEVESMQVLEMLNKELAPAKYQSIVFVPGPDQRGINTAILSRLELAEKPQLHLIPYAKESDGFLKSRGILEAQFKLEDNQRMTAFAVHFPAPYHPIDKRIAAFSKLNKLAEMAAKKSSLLIAAGDFNVKAEEDSRLYRQLASQKWQVSHLVGCSQCIGTHYYQQNDSWSFLDAILLWKADSSWQINSESVQVISEVAEQRSKNSFVPRAFDPKKLQGVSDHFPLYLELESKKQAIVAQ